MSTHKCEVVPVRLQPHPNADSLSVVSVFGWNCCVRTADWEGKTLGVYIPPDSVVPDTPQFSFLGERRRIRVMRLRGYISQGLLMPSPEGAEVGDDFMEEWGITHYEPPMDLVAGGDNESPPVGYFPVYDIEPLNRYPHLFNPGETVVVTEKIHGANSRYAFQDGRMWCGSHNNWKKQNPQVMWWKALEHNPEIEVFCRAYPEYVVYCEVFGPVQKLKYGSPNRLRIAVFDILRRDHWLDFTEARELAVNLPWVPVLYHGPFDMDRIRALAEGDSVVPGADHMAEGVVVKPSIERRCPEVGRVQLKLVGNRYLQKD